MTFDGEPDVVSSFDGTSIAARRFVGGDGTPVLLCNAIGANIAAWRSALTDLSTARPVFTWDYRGLLDSGIPASNRIDPGAHAEDAMAVLAHFEAESVGVVGWSTGTRIAIEIARRYPEHTVALVLVCGGYGYSIGGLAARREWPAIFPIAASVAKHFGSVFEGIVRGLASRPEIGALIRHSGLVGATADTASLVELMRGVAACDGRRLLAVYEAVAGDSAASALHEIEAPTLLIAGEHDHFTPNSVYEEMMRSLTPAHFELYPRATHFLPLEYPARLAGDIDGLVAALTRP